ncbi:MAG: hypothetical protein JWN78_306 [Bacteroidota bacterium]|nr:hypothetical protein [Bacteroidota bacterium]
MKSKLLFSFAVVAAFAVVMFSGCSKSSTTNNNNNGCFDFATASDTGQHTVYAGTVALPLSKIHDSLTAAVSGTTVTIHTQALNRNLTGTINASDCNQIDLDSIIFGVNDSLLIPTTLSGLGGFVRIKNVRAGGTGKIDANGVITTKINVVSGTTNISTPIDLTNITPAIGLNLQGTFIHR